MSDETPQHPYTAFFRFKYVDNTPAFLLGFYNEEYLLPNPGDAFILTGSSMGVKVLSVHKLRDMELPFYDITIQAVEEETS